MAKLKGHNELHLSLLTVQDVMKEWLGVTWPNEAGTITGISYDVTRNVFIVTMDEIPAPMPSNVPEVPPTG